MKDIKDIIENNERTPEEKIIDIANKLFEGERHNAVLTKDERDKIKQNTRHYAKRQITFFKRLEGLKSLTPNLDNALEIIMQDIKNAK